MNIRELEKYNPSGYYDVRSQLKDYVYDLSTKALEKGMKERDGIVTVEELEKRRKYVRESFIQALGGIPSSETPLNAKVKDIIKFDGFRVEKVIFESRPQNYVTANLYIPNHIQAPSAAVLFLCGHDHGAKHSNEYQVVCQHLVQAGLIVFAQDPIGQGERFSYYESSIGRTTVLQGTTEHAYAGSQCLPVGYPSARYFLHDAMRGVDYLASRPEVDTSRIGVTGNSGGGMQTAMMMLADSRIAAAAPGTFITSRMKNMRTGLAQDSEQNWPGLGKLGFDHEDILLCMAPKPVMVLAVKYDFFPIEGTRESVKRTKRFWDMYGRGENIRLEEDSSGHKYTEKLAKSAAAFFIEVLKSNKQAIEEKSINLIEQKKFWCTNTGQIRREMPDARSIFEENLDCLSKIEINRSSVSEERRKEEAFQWLKEKVFNSRKPCDTNTRHITEWQLLDLYVQSSIWWSQEGLLNHGLTFRNYAFFGRDIPATIAVWDGGTTELQLHLQWIRKICESGRAVIVLNTSGAGAIMPNPLTGRSTTELFGALYKLSDDLIWMDDSLAAMRTYDVIRLMDALREWPGIICKDIKLYGYGKHGIYAQLAALIDERVQTIEIIEGIGSYASWVKARYYDPEDVMSILIPGILRYFDIPDLNNWLKKEHKM